MPAAVPLTAAMIGNSESKMAGNRVYWPSSIIRRASPTTRSGTPSGRSDGTRWLKSAPGQNSFSPLAVSTMARAVWAPLRPLIRSRMRLRHGGERALPFSGRSIVIQATSSTISNRTCSSRGRSVGVVSDTEDLLGRGLGRRVETRLRR